MSRPMVRMRRIVAALALLPLLAGCGALAAFRSPHAEPQQLELYKHEARYELLTHVSARVCAQDDEFYAIKRTRSADPRAVGAGYLFDRAKYEALEKLPTADGLLAVRAKVEVFANGQCITVTGRAYRITAIEAVTPAHQSEDALTAEPQEEQPKKTSPNDQL
ncbi:MAG: hypothetical protein JWM53_1196 [bacterium]|nr:hypothetical protein [bacterium]